MFITWSIWFKTPAHATFIICETYDCLQTPKPTPSPTPKPFHFACRENECVKVEGKGDNQCLPQIWEGECQVKSTPSPTPSPTPKITPAPPQALTTPQGPFDAPSSSCTAPIDAPKLTGFKSNADGSIIFGWWPSVSANVDAQSINYGYAPDKLVYGVNNLNKNLREFTIKGMIPNVNHWARIGAWSNGCVIWSNTLDP